MTGQNDRPDESLTGQVHDQAGHCPLTGCYFEPWDSIKDFIIWKMNPLVVPVTRFKFKLAFLMSNE